MSAITTTDHAKLTRVVRLDLSEDEYLPGVGHRKAGNKGRSEAKIVRVSITYEWSFEKGEWVVPWSGINLVFRHILKDGSLGAENQGRFTNNPSVQHLVDAHKPTTHIDLYEVLA